MPGRVTAERRVDPTDGKAYTRAEFVECYGGSAEWDAAQRVGGASNDTASPTPSPSASAGRAAAAKQSTPAAQPAGRKSPPPKAAPQETEYRRDPEDGKAYTKQDFLDCYGGTKEWDAAPVCKGEALKERRRDPSDGRMYTKQDFLDCYGGTKEWEAAAASSTGAGGGGGSTAKAPVKAAAAPAPAPASVPKAAPAAPATPAPVAVKAKVAEPRQQQQQAEKRRDASDGRMYTRDEFVECYGGAKEWDAAGQQQQQGSRGGGGASASAAALAAMTDEEVTALCQQRQDARRARDFKLADTLRDKIRKLGIAVDDDNRVWKAGSRTGQWNAGGGSRGGGGGKGGGRAPQTSAWTAGLQDAKRATSKHDDASWGASDGSALVETYPPPQNAAKLDAFLQDDSLGMQPGDKMQILLALPLEVFWGWIATSDTARRWIGANITPVVSSHDGRGAAADAAVRLLSRLAFYTDPVDTKFSIGSYASLLCTTVFTMDNIIALAKHAAKITLLKETLCAVLVACHHHYFGGIRSDRGALTIYLKEVERELKRIIHSERWPAVAKEISTARRYLVEGLWSLLKVAPFLVRCMSPICDWTALLTVFHEVPVAALLQRTDGKVGHDLCAACVDIVRIVLQYYPFPEVDESEGDFGSPYSRIEAALHQSMRSFSLVSPIKLDRIPPNFATLLSRTYGNEGSESFLMFEVLSKLHQHTSDLLAEAAPVPSGGRGGGGGGGKGKPKQQQQQQGPGAPTPPVYIDVSVPGKFVVDLVTVYKMDTTLFREAASLGRITHEEMDTLCSIVAGLLQEPERKRGGGGGGGGGGGVGGGGGSPAPAAGGDFPAVFPEECDTLLQIVGEGGLVKSQHHAYSVLKYFEMDLEKAIAAVFDSNLPPHLVEDTAPQGGGGAAAQASSSSSAAEEPAPVKKVRAPPVNPVTNPERFADFTQMQRKPKLSKEEEFDDMMRQRIVQAQQRQLREYDDEADDTCDYIPGGALEEEKKRRTMQNHTVQRAATQKITVREAEIPVQDELPTENTAGDCPSDEEWGGYGGSGDEDDEEDEEEPQKRWGPDAAPGGRGRGGGGKRRGGGGGGGGGFPRALSGESTGAFKGKSKIRASTDDDKKRRSALDKNKGRYGNHDRKDGAARKARKAMI